MSEKNESAIQSEGEERKKRAQTKPGEKIFSFLLLLLGIYFTWQSYQYFLDKPAISEYGALPLILGVILIILSGVTIVTDFFRESELKSQKPGQRIVNTLKYLVPRADAVMILLIAIYTTTFFLGVSFWINTPIFLWVSMAYLHRRDYLKNILWIGIILAFIYLVFKVAFSVVFP